MNEGIISFFVASQECAPLPLLTLHEESGENRPTNSFDLLFEMMKQQMSSSEAFSHNQKEGMKERKMELLQRLRSDIAAVDTGCGVEEPPQSWSQASRCQVYDIMCRYFRSLAGVYAMRDDIDIRFSPMSEVSPVHPINKAAAGHFKGLHQLTKMDSPDWGSKAPERVRGVMGLSLMELARRPYWFNVCMHAYKIRLEEAGIV